MKFKAVLKWMLLCQCFAGRLTIKYARSSGPGGQNVNKGVYCLAAKMRQLKIYCR